MTSDFMRFLNLVALFLVCVVLSAAFYIQFTSDAFNCPLCLLQRLGMIAVGFGLVLNLTCGLRPGHYGMMLIGAVFGAITSITQITLHIVPGTGAYGAPIFGLHLYTWAFISFGLVFLLSGFALLVERQFHRQGGSPSGFINGASQFVVGIFILLIAGNVVSTFLECGIKQCPSGAEVSDQIEDST